MSFSEWLQSKGNAESLALELGVAPSTIRLWAKGFPARGTSIRKLKAAGCPDADLPEDKAIKNRMTVEERCISLLAPVLGTGWEVRIRRKGRFLIAKEGASDRYWVKRHQGRLDEDIAIDGTWGAYNA